ncbi:MAG: replication factor C large subunit [Nitrosarchaeum sp.]|nr:replication factor C large subunit [Nitrosarchaeum sp.]
MTSAPWIHTHKPLSLQEIKGQEKALAALSAHLASHKPGQKALLLHGPSGSGKTCAVYALAHDKDLEILEVNASDTRNAAGIEAVIGQASKTGSLFGRRKIIFIDELDGLSGTSDRGAGQALVRIIKESAFPIILAANDAYAQKLQALRKHAEVITFSEVSFEDIQTILSSIAKREGVATDEQTLRALARRAGGDMRAAINDLQMLCTSGTLDKSMLEELSERHRTQSMEHALIRVLKSTQASVALGAFDDVSEDLDKIFLWIDQNIPQEYTRPADVHRAYEAIAHADVFFGRIRRWQHYRFYVYCYILLSVGVALAKDERYPGTPAYKESSRILKIWWANQKGMKKKSIAGKVAEHTHTSTRRALKDVLPYLKIASPQLPKHALEGMADLLGLDESEIAWLRT